VSRLNVSQISPLPEFRQLWIFARDGWRNGARPWLAIALTAATVAVSLLLHFHALQPELWRSGDAYASLPFTTELSRLPMSLLFPTPYLPLWAACGQLLVVVGLGELILGRWLATLIAIAAHFGSTLVARVLLDSLHHNVFGLSPALAHVLDTGPSAVTAAIGACVLVAARMNRCAALLVIGLVAAALIAPGVDGIEHLVALACGLLAGLGLRVVSSRPPKVIRPPSLVIVSSLRATWMTRVLRYPVMAWAIVRALGARARATR
jgi:hypothetical protein